MATIIKKKKKNQYYLVRSARVNGKPRIVSQQYLGRAEDIGKAMGGRSDLDRLLKKVYYDPRSTLFMPD